MVVCVFVSVLVLVVCVLVCTCVCLSVLVCLCACTRACVRLRACVFLPSVFLSFSHTGWKDQQSGLRLAARGAVEGNSSPQTERCLQQPACATLTMGPRPSASF